MPPRVMSALEIPTDRPDFLTVASRAGVPPPASAVPSVTQPSEKRTSRPLCSHVYINLTPDPELLLESRRYAYAYITRPAPGAPARRRGRGRGRGRARPPAQPESFVRAAMRAAGLDYLDFDALRSCYGDLALRFRSPEDREVAMAKQPFPLDGGGSVKLVREGETPNVTSVTFDHLTHVVLRDYPAEQRADEEDIHNSCSGFGFIEEIDPACLAAGAPDLSPVHLVVNLAGLEQARQIPRELRIEYWMYGLRSVVPIEILRIWHLAESLDADGRYVPLFRHDPPAAEAGA